MRVLNGKRYGTGSVSDLSADALPGEKYQSRIAKVLGDNKSHGRATAAERSAIFDNRPKL
jgi:hypothetical protein